VPSKEYLQSVLLRVKTRIEEGYGIPISFMEIPVPYTGDLDGAEIRIDKDRDVELALFTLAHLFGHTVQWNTSERARNIGRNPAGQYSAAELDEVAAYEREASRYSLHLLHETGVTDLDQWLSDLAAADVSYLMHFYATGERKPFGDFFKANQPMLSPLEVPPFTPHRWKSRWDGIVI
jgi:hypothetical protein